MSQHDASFGENGQQVGFLHGRLVARMVHMVLWILPSVFLNGCSCLLPWDDCCGPKRPKTLQEAAEAGELALVRKFLAKGSDLNARDSLSRQAIHGAAESGILELVHYLLAQGADARSRDTFGDMPIHFAAEQGHEETVAYLLENGAKIEDAGQWGGTPLYQAADCGDYETVKLLVERGARVRVKTDSDSGGWMPIHQAATSKSVATVEYLLRHGATVHDRTDSDDTPLHLAMKHGSDDVVRCLLKHGANPRTHGNWGVGGIHTAAGERGDLAMVQLFVRQGVKVTQRDAEGMLPMHYAARHGRTEIMKWLAGQGSSVDKPSSVYKRTDFYEFGDEKMRAYGAVRPLHEACSSGNLETVTWLLEQGAAVNARTASGDTPLMDSVANAEIVKLLLERGADPNIANRFGSNALHDACGPCGNLESARHLLDHGANPNAEDSAGNQPIHLACDKGRLEITRLLVSRGADIHARSGSGQTPLARAAGFYPYPELVDFLIQQGADVNAIDHYGISIVAWCRHANILKKLLRRGANVNTASKSGATPLHVAADDRDAAERIALLLSRGAKVNAADGEGNTPLHEAALFGYLENVKLLVKHGADLHAKNKQEQTPADITLKYSQNEDRIKTREFLMSRMK